MHASDSLGPVGPLDAEFSDFLSQCWASVLKFLLLFQQHVNSLALFPQEAHGKLYAGLVVIEDQGIRTLV